MLRAVASVQALLTLRSPVIPPIAFGRCPCGGSYETRMIEVRVSSGGTVHVVTGVPQGACPACGSRIYKAHVLARLEALMHGPAVAPQDGAAASRATADG